MSDAVCVPALRVTLPAHRDSLALLRHVVRGFRDAYVIAPATMDDIVLAVSEAATNAVVHAYGSRPGTLTLVAQMRDGATAHRRPRPRLRHRATRTTLRSPATGSRSWSTSPLRLRSSAARRARTC